MLFNSKHTFCVEFIFVLEIEAKNYTFKNFMLLHCIFAFEMSLPIYVLCIGTKPRNFSKMSKLDKTSLIKILR